MQSEKDKLNKERNELLNRIQEFSEIPLIILGFAWLILLVIELIKGLNTELQLASTLIWIIFILDFTIKFILAPAKFLFLKKNVLTAISLLIPALRIFRIARIYRILSSIRAVRGLRLVRILTSINRGMRSLAASMQRRAVGYVLILTLFVLFVGAAGMHAFERDVEKGLETYGEALWWTAMLLTSIASEYWPQTSEGRLLCFILGLYGFAVFGYFTAALATFFVGRDAEDSRGEVAGSKQIEKLTRELVNLRKEIQNFRSSGNLKAGDQE